MSIILCVTLFTGLVSVKDCGGVAIGVNVCVFVSIWGGQREDSGKEGICNRKW